MKRIVAISFLAIGSSVLLAAPASTNTSAAGTNSASATADEVVAKGKGIQIKRSDLEQAMSAIKKSMRGQEVPPEQLKSIQPQMLERLIAMRLLAARATDADKAKAKENTEKRVAEMEKNSGGKEKLTAQLQALGVSIEEFRTRLGEEALAEAVFEREVKAEVPEAEIKKFYEENPARFEEPEQVRASHILLLTQDEQGKELSEDQKKEKRKQIEDLLKKARAGEDFAKLAKEHSQDPGSKDRGGEYKFPRGQMVPEFEKTAFGLKTNEVSDVVTTQYGYHIIKLHEKIPARVVPFSEAEPRIKEALRVQSLQKQMPQYLEKLRKEADVQILDESLKPQEPPKMEGPGSDEPPTPAPSPSPGDKKADAKKK